MGKLTGGGSRVLVLMGASGAAGIFCLTPILAGAESTKDACFDAYEQAQHLRKEGKLRGAKRQLMQCATSECPRLIANDCLRWSHEVEVITPTVIFVAKDASGHDLVDVQVTVDGEEVQRQIDGRVVELDPGPHTARFRWKEHAADVSAVLVEGENARRLEAKFGDSMATLPVSMDAEGKRVIPMASYALAGVAAVSVASFVGFGLAGKNQESCAPHCTAAEVGTLRRDYLIADVSWITGLVALTGAIVFWRIQPVTYKTVRSGQAVGVSFEPLRGGAALGASGSF